ncbi:MAG: (NiFe) hydrogenase maturation protein HypF [Nocardioidaceae bacterium]|nr:(NiFe) hydrogenase maturation protein HypF [Nocardioidaceae bacterium]
MSAGRVRRRFQVTGMVQGVGFRPFVYVAGTELGLTGSVANDASGVVVEVEGPRPAVDELGRRLSRDAPPLAVVESVSATELPVVGGTGFAIAGSHRGRTSGRTLAGPDVATCADCLRELADPADRRYRHPFISCTNCGPRFTIIRDLPYDRGSTTMAQFAMCDACAAEYSDPADRRFHAQPIACHDCGPRLELVEAGGGNSHDDDALHAAGRLLGQGAIIAVKGLGGYHLACDARNEDAVAELRRRKHRGAKPFAVMVRDLDAARAVADVDDVEAALLTGARRPVVLLARNDGAPLVADAVAPGNPDLGVLLPYTPVHSLLLDASGAAGTGLRCLVMTSGNLGGEPIAYRDDDAAVRLAPLVDAWLRHDRLIHVPVDDSVSRVVDGRECPVRRSRGYAPLPVALPVPVPPTLAVGADLKNTCAVGEGRYAWLSQHIGDMDDLATLDAFTASEGHLQRLVGVLPERLAADAHPAYRSSAWATRHADGRPVHTVQHHHAHVAAVMAEHGLDGREQVIGFAFDGTGYGTDGAVWGGEVLVADYKGFSRVAHLGYVPLAGGDASVHRPYRMALAHLRAAGVQWRPDLAPVAACPPDELTVLDHQLASGFGTTPTSSMGRLFDAVASLAGVRHVVDFEAQAAIELEGLARGVDADGGYEFGLARAGSGPTLASAAPVVRAVVGDRGRGVPAEVVAARFHTALADLVVELARVARAETGLVTVALAGGVFANALLLSAARHRLEHEGFVVLSPQQVPANDGGIALGQLLVAAQG